MRSFAVIAVLLAVAAAGCTVRTQPEPYAHGVYGSSPSNPMAEGEVARVDAGNRVIVLSNGQAYQVPADSVVYVNGQPVAWTTVQPGSRVMLTQGQLVELRDGRYVVVQSPAVVTSPAPGTVTAAPGTTVVTAPVVTGTRHTIYGKVTDVDRDGEITVKTGKGEEFEMRLAPSAAAGIRAGDSVTLDVVITPSSPSALPRR
jgi:hypothetical protein